MFLSCQTYPKYVQHSSMVQKVIAKSLLISNKLCYHLYFNTTTGPCVSVRVLSLEPDHLNLSHASVIFKLCDLGKIKLALCPLPHLLSRIDNLIVLLLPKWDLWEN